MRKSKDIEQYREYGQMDESDGDNMFHKRYSVYTINLYA